jgi:adenosylcobinamide-phosphate synthase
MSFAAMMLVAMAIDAVLGWPNRLYARIGHPVTWIGALIGALDQRWNRTGDSPARRKLAGVAAALVVISGAGGLAWLVQSVLPQGWLGIAIGGVLAWHCDWRSVGLAVGSSAVYARPCTGSGAAFGVERSGGRAVRRVDDRWA